MRDGRRAWRPVPVVVVLASLLFGGCASRGGPGMDCRSQLLPHHVSLAEFADSSELQDALASAWDERTGLAVAAVRYDSVGALDTVQVWSDAPAVASADPMAAAIRAASPERREPDAEIELFLGDARGPAVRRVRPLGFCAPRMTNLDVVAARLSEEARRSLLDRSRVVRVMVYIGTDGRVRVAELVEGSGHPAIDAMVLQVIQEAAFEPAVVEGMPIGAWTTLPITLQRGRSGPGAEGRP